MQFFGYFVFLQGVCIKEERMEAIGNWLESWLVWDIQLFLVFATFTNNSSRISAG